MSNVEQQEASNTRDASYNGEASNLRDDSSSMDASNISDNSNSRNASNIRNDSNSMVCWQKLNSMLNMKNMWKKERTSKKAKVYR
jgi:hypothetical protein